MPERVTSLTAPAVIGETYLVPTVFYSWPGAKNPKAWPVFPNLHEDKEIFGADFMHYHIDPRFLLDREIRRVEQVYKYMPFRGIHLITGLPLSKRGAWPGGCEPHPDIVWRRIKCRRALLVENPLGHRVQPHYAGQQCAKGRSGWICPHRNFPLGSVEPDVDGNLSCPLHGLKIAAANGVVVGVHDAPSTLTFEPYHV